jgi:hypothetical protein
MSLRSSAPHVVAAVFIAVAAAGCSSGSTQPQVAALPTSAASGGSPAASASAGDPTSGSPGASASASASTSSRPRERLDETPSQTEALYAPWNQCLTAHGAGRGDKPTQAVQTAAQAACAHLDPLPPWQYDPANPKAMGFVQQVVACLHQHGVQYAQVQNPPGQGRIEIALGGPQNDQASISAGLELIPTCDQQVLRENVSSTSP